MPRTLRSLLPCLLALLLALVASACTSEPEDDATDTAVTVPATTPPPPVEVRASTPIEGFRAVDRELLERDRNEDSWRRAAERYRANERRREAIGTAPPGGATAIDRLREGGAAGATGGAATDTAGAETAPDSAAPASESWDDLATEEVFERPPVLPVPQSGGGPTVLRVQQMLDRVGFSPGVIDGRWGKNTEKAVYWLQDALGEEPTGEVDRALFDRLAAEVGGSAVHTYAVTDSDLSGDYVEIPEEPTAMAELDCLCYESAQEAIAERFHTTTDLLAQLNPGVDLEALTAGTELRVPDVETPAEARQPASRIARIEISNDGKFLHVFDAAGNLIHHFPTTVGGGYDSSPEGELEVQSIALEPDFHYQPKLFHDVPDEDEDALLPAGPNSPVGEVWIQLSKENYGIHGTAEPQTIGYATSHGCVRLTNWDAIRLANQVPQGTTVTFLESDEAGGTETAEPASEETTGN